MRVIAEISICAACLAVADGEPVQTDSDTQAACTTAAAGMAETWPGLAVHGTGGEGGFSRLECEGCGNLDGGDRYPAVVLGPDQPLTLTVTTVEYVPTGDGDRDVQRERGTTVEFDSAAEVAQWLRRECVDQPSSGPEFCPSVWFANEPYEHPEGYRIERTAHRDAATVTDAAWREVWTRLSA